MIINSKIILYTTIASPRLEKTLLSLQEELVKAEAAYALGLMIAN